MMRTPLIAVILALFLCSIMLSACGGTADTNAPAAANRPSNSNANTAKSNVEELSLHVRVPYEAEDIVWQQDPSTKSIIAVFSFSPADAAKLTADAQAAGPGRSVSLPVEAWFPHELIAQGEMSGDSTVKGTAYGANAFFQDPYNSGRITRIEGMDYFVLEVSAK